MALDRLALSDDVLEFLRERHLATLSISRDGGPPHVTPVGFTWDNDAGVVRVITWTDSKKARLTSEAEMLPVAVSQVDGGRWLTLEGVASVTTDPEACAEGCRRYAERYREPAHRPDRAIIEIRVTKILGRA
ncbi:MAG: pyridoxamine 5'-phosphate oxidase family protein [Actinomycetota bacterium]|nr:pyridoxamine 5'-phosphate oxidase family protein [Actinomycetota bacterium]